MKIKSVFFLVILIPFFFGSCKKNTLLPSHEIRSLSSDSVSWVFNHNGRNYPATVPGTIHTDLMENKIIKDPFFGTNEQAVQWVSGRVWTYSTTFDAGNCNLYENATLVFDGLDTYAEVYLNGKPLNHTEGSHVTNNMFRQWRFPLPKDLKEKGNTLVVKFLPSVPKEEALAKKLPYKLPDNRVFSRKAPYQSGWDWGPKLITAGMWKNVYIDLWNQFAIDKIVIKQTELTKKRGVLEVKTTVQSNIDGSVELNYYLDDRRVETKKTSLKKGENVVSETITLRNPEFWWPAGMGKQKRYQVKVTAQNDKFDRFQREFLGI
jgi:beta-mannosidase